MFRFLLTPRWIAVHVVLLLAITFCVAAGWWQYGVFQDSKERHDDRDRPPVPISELLQPAEDLGDAVDRSAVARGSYLTQHQQLVPGRIREGVLGWFVVAPLETRDGTIVPVVRGWVDDPAAADTPRATSMTVTGHLLPPEVPEHATVRSDQVLDDDELAYISPESIEAATGLSPSTSVHGYLLATAEDPPANDAARVDVDEVAPIRNVNPWQNFSYWAQWWLFAAAGVAFWVSAVRAGIRSRRTDDDAGPDGPGQPVDTEVSEPAPRHVPS